MEWVDQPDVWHATPEITIDFSKPLSIDVAMGSVTFVGTYLGGERTVEVMPTESLAAHERKIARLMWCNAHPITTIIK